jgi:7-cyano-7-deazaguanine synthase
VEALTYALINRAAIRGRDSCGYAVFNNINGMGTRVRKVTTHPSDIRVELYANDKCLISNNRAEPTNEWVREKDSSTVHPFSDVQETVWAVHNGTIANDKDYGAFKIDSEAIPATIVSGHYFDLVGSQATAFYSERPYTQSNGVEIEPNCLYIFRNYRPASMVFIRDLGLFLFSSMMSTLEQVCEEFNLSYQPVNLPPWALTRIRGSSVDVVYEVPTPRGSEESAIVVCSGGLDSTTAATIACDNHQEIVLGHFHYGCQAEAKETKAVQLVTLALQKKFPNKKVVNEFFDLSFIKNLGGNALTDHSMKLAKGETGVEFAHEWVPFRNGVMTALVAAYCDRWNIGNIYLGANLEEAGAYGDNEEEFYMHFNRALQIGSVSRPVIHNPLGHLMKHEIVKLAREIGAPVDQSWSCYAGDKIHCGECGPCYLRSKAFKMNGLIDHIKYAKLPEGFWDGCSDC